MTMRRSRSALAVAAIFAGIAVAAVAFRGRVMERREPFVRARSALPASVRTAGGVRFVETRDSPAELLPDTVLPSRNVRLQWLNGRSAHPTRNGAVVLDDGGGVVEFDRRLRPTQRLLYSEGREWLSVAAAPANELWLTDATGALVRAGRDGKVRAAPPTAFHYAAVVSEPSRGTPWLVRSAQRFAYVFDSLDSPLILRADSTGAVSRAIGRAVRPEHVLLEDLANAGHLAVTDTLIFFAPFIRDELVAMTMEGDTVWVATRGLPQSTAEPRFELRERRAVVNYNPVNLGLTIGLDGHVYLLSTPGPTTSESRLDVFDEATGALLRTARFSTALPTLAGDGEGRVYQLDPLRLLAGVAPKEREAVPPYDLPSLGGGRLAIAAERGKVVLLNVWASWCAPCRDEMPALDSLQREFRTQQFAFVTVSDDVSPNDARRFLDARGFTFPTALGEGKARSQFHIPGLPATILVDRDGREVRRWVGFTGPAQIAAIRALVRAEIDRTGDSPDSAPEHHHHVSIKPAPDPHD
jgi:thiol-disulfide isomerase/thioredoxin